MEIRELLRTEIWSKSTSRKILSVGVKILRVVEIFVVGYVVLYIVNATWLTASERTVGRVALVEIDALQHFDGMSDEEYARDYKRAETNVEAAEGAARTERDEKIAFNLSAYLMFTNIRREDQEYRTRLSNSKDERVRNLSTQTGPSPIPANEFESGLLHQALR